MQAHVLHTAQGTAQIFPANAGAMRGTALHATHIAIITAWAPSTRANWQLISNAASNLSRGTFGTTVPPNAQPKFGTTGLPITSSQHPSAPLQLPRHLNKLNRPQPKAGVIVCIVTDAHAHWLNMCIVLDAHNMCIVLDAHTKMCMHRYIRCTHIFCKNECRYKYLLLWLVSI